MSPVTNSVRSRIHLSVVGSSLASPEEAAVAERVGREVARAGAVLVTGGLGGVMEAASRGARLEGGLVVGILPGTSRIEANPWVDVAIPTGLGEARNVVVVMAADAVVAVGGEYGTLSEIAHALKLGKPVVGLATWQLARAGRPDTRIREASSPEEAVRLALDLARAATVRGSRL